VKCWAASNDGGVTYSTSPCVKVACTYSSAPTQVPTVKPTHKKRVKRWFTKAPTRNPTKRPTPFPTSRPTSLPTVVLRCKDFMLCQHHPIASDRLYLGRYKYSGRYHSARPVFQLQKEFMGETHIQVMYMYFSSFSSMWAVSPTVGGRAFHMDVKSQVQKDQFA
jgi:hypothetical protein